MPLNTLLILDVKKSTISNKTRNRKLLTQLTEDEFNETSQLQKLSCRQFGEDIKPCYFNRVEFEKVQERSHRSSAARFGGNCKSNNKNKPDVMVRTVITIYCAFQTDSKTARHTELAKLRHLNNEIRSLHNLCASCTLNWAKINEVAHLSS